MPPGHEYPITPPPADTVAEPVKKSWVHRHPYLASSVAVIALLGLALSILATRTGVGANQSGDNWVGAGSVFFTGGQRLTETERLRAQDVVKQQSEQADLGYIPIASPLEGTGAEEPSFGNDLTALLAQLVQPAAGNEGNTNVETSSAFSFIPQGLISIANTERQPTPEADALHTYGNDIGTYIQGFESMHSNSAQILKDHAEDRGNADKAAKVDQLGYELAALGRDLNLLETVPEDVKAAHSALSTSYRLVGTNLTKIAATKTDEEFLDAINAYNASVEGLSKRFFVLVGIFSANNVTFSSSEPGSIFMFNPTFTF